MSARATHRPPESRRLQARHQRLDRGYNLGVANPEAGINGLPHSPDFAADEHAIGIGVRAMAGFLSHRLDALA
ncbi:hypothetical protein B1R27_36015 [Streptomyces sp. GKU 895]|nr:hypothetical protein B1R27_36015 [Streptomyces sp. GKU 895]